MIRNKFPSTGTYSLLHKAFDTSAGSKGPLEISYIRRPVFERLTSLSSSLDWAYHAGNALRMRIRIVGAKQPSNITPTGSFVLACSGNLQLSSVGLSLRSRHADDDLLHDGRFHAVRGLDPICRTHQRLVFDDIARVGGDGHAEQPGRNGRLCDRPFRLIDAGSGRAVLLAGTRGL